MNPEIQKIIDHTDAVLKYGTPGHSGGSHELHGGNNEEKKIKIRNLKIKHILKKE